ncbi:fimbrial biogenesis chaperone [Shewanella sp.]|uniref:fimbrial biogenesis chaperone n=1 Tax=Shewanella sp. TaxID=50422 RepID=UPI00405453FF
MNKHLLFGTAALLLGCAFSDSLQANLLVTPTRVELDEKRAKSAVFSLVNKGTKTSRYEIYFEEKRMLPSGDFVTLSKDDGIAKANRAIDEALISQMQATSIAKYLRYSPRRLTLEPEQGGRVRLALRTPKTLPEGEYRSYIVFHQIPLAPKVQNNNTSKDGQSLSLTISAYMKIAVPIFLRVGDLKADISLNTGKLELSQGQQSLQVSLHRQGARSSYGDLEVINPVNNQVLGSLNNAAVYSELNEKSYSVPLSETLSPGSELIIRFTESDKLFEHQRIETRLRF